ncbi:hypothetical protein ACIOG4_27645 [Streptomyces microflavus]|uniref:hypothetical protein n=1 Tax=Streptomyces microflavus TaxID=1919 RepID=UPI003819BFBE
MGDKTALQLTVHSTHADDHDAICAALAAQGLEVMRDEYLDAPAGGSTFTDPEVDISNGFEHRTLAEAIAADTRHTRFELVHFPDGANVGHYAAYAPGHPLYLAFADVDGDPYKITEQVALSLAEARTGMTVQEWLEAHGGDLLGTDVRAAVQASSSGGA